MRGRGRTPFQGGDPEKIEAAERGLWVLVELMRDRKGELERHSIRKASGMLADKIKATTKTTGESLRKIHRKAEKRRETEPAFASFADDELERVRRERDRRGWDADPMELLLVL